MRPRPRLIPSPSACYARYSLVREGRLLLIFAAALFSVRIAGAQTLEEARSQWRAYEEAQAALHNPALQTDAKALQENDLQARTSLRQAKALYEAAGAEEANDLAVRLEYVTVLETLRDYDLAAEVLSAALPLGPGNAAVWRRYGQALYRAGSAHRAEAFPALHKALALDLDSAEGLLTHLALGEAYIEEGLFQCARPHYRAAHDLDSASVPARTGLAVLLVYDGNIEAGAAELDALGQEAMPLDEFIRRALRRVLPSLEKWHAVPAVPEAHRAYARLLYRAAMPQEAILAAEHAVAERPEDTELWNLLASIHAQLGNLAEAQRAYQHSLATNPAQPNVQQALSQIQAALSKP